jgi:hypothetical protein
MDGEKHFSSRRFVCSEYCISFAIGYIEIDIMQIVQLKDNIISWVTGLNDKKLIDKLYQWTQEQEPAEIAAKGIVPPRSIGSLTEGYGFWADDAPPFDETNYRDKLWQTEKNAW